MTPFLLYIVRSGLYLAVFYAFYLLVMRRTTLFRFNRFALLLGTAACALLPLLRVRTAAAGAAAGPLALAGVADAVPAAPQAGGAWSALPATVYAAGALLVAALTLAGAAKIRRLARRGQRTRRDGFRTVLLPADVPSFTLGKTVFISEKDLAENPAIFTHETMHVKSRHYLDLFLMRAFQILWWWNPLVWIIRTELGLLHEYEADEGVIKQGIDATQYQLLLVRKAVGEQRFSLASGFQHAQLKKRITMMFKTATSGWMRLSYLALVPVLALLVYACNPARENHEPAPAGEPAAAAPATKADTTVHSEYRITVTDEPSAEALPYGVVEQKPSFNGGDANEFAKWVNQHLNYPEAAKTAGIEGRVIVMFTVEADGSMSDIRVIRSVDPILDAEALRVMNSCTVKWEPGIQNGKPVGVTFAFPITFQLR